MAEEEDNDEVVDAMASRLETLDVDGDQEEDEEEANADGMAEANADGANGPPLSAVVARLSALDALVAAERAAASAAAARRHDPSLFDGACAALTLALEACGPQGDEVRARGAELARMLSGGAAESSSGGGDGQQKKEKEKENKKEKEKEKEKEKKAPQKQFKLSLSAAQKRRFGDALMTLSWRPCGRYTEELCVRDGLSR